MSLHAITRTQWNVIKRSHAWAQWRSCQLLRCFAQRSRYPLGCRLESQCSRFHGTWVFSNPGDIGKSGKTQYVCLYTNRVIPIKNNLTRMPVFVIKHLKKLMTKLRRRVESYIMKSISGIQVTLKGILAVSLKVVFMTLLFMTLICLVSILKFGSIRCGIAWLSGQEIFVENREFFKSFDSDDQKIRVHFKLKHLGVETIDLGYDNSCACAILGLLPGYVKPLETIEISADIDLVGQSNKGIVEGFIKIFTNHQNFKEIVLTYRFILNSKQVNVSMDHISNGKVRTQFCNCDTPSSADPLPV